MSVNKVIRSVIGVLLLLGSSMGFAQGVLVSADSSRLLFPNNVSIDLTKRTGKGLTTFILNPTSLKTMMVQWNYLYDMLETNRSQVRLLENELHVRDSVIETLKTQLKVTDDRLLVYESGYEDVKSIARDYDTQVKTLISELEIIQKNNRKAKRRMFSKGALAGLIGGIAITSFFILR